MVSFYNFCSWKFRSYTIGSKLTIYSNTVIKYLENKKETKPRITPWIILLQEFNFTIKDRKGLDNPVADHFIRSSKNKRTIQYKVVFFYEYLFKLDLHVPWYVDIVNYLVTSYLPIHFSYNEKYKLKSESKYYVWESSYLWKIGLDQIVRRRVAKNEHESILSFFFHERACGGHFGPNRITRKILYSWFYWKTLFTDIYAYCKSC